jgi:hypothetical protein
MEVWVLAEPSKQGFGGMHSMWCLTYGRDKKAEETSSGWLWRYKEVREYYECNQSGDGKLFE